MKISLELDPTDIDAIGECIGEVVGAIASGQREITVAHNDMMAGVTTTAIAKVTEYLSGKEAAAMAHHERYDHDAYGLPGPLRAVRNGSPGLSTAGVPQE